MTSPLPLVWGIGLTPTSLCSLAGLDATVVTTTDPDEVRPVACGPLALVVTTAGAIAAVRGAGSMLAAAPLLAILDSAAEAVAAMEAGADWVLLEPLEAGLLAAVFVAAARLAKERMLRRAAMTAVDLASDSIEITDPAANIEYVNRAFERMTGYSREEAVGRTPAQLLRSHLHDGHFYKGMAETIGGKRTWSGSLIGRRKDGVLVAQIATVQPILDDGGVVCHHVALKQFLPAVSGAATIASESDATEHVRASVASVVSSELRYRTMMATAADAILISDRDTSHLLEMNPAAHRMFGYEATELSDLTLRTLAAPEAGGIADRVTQTLRDTGAALEHRYPMQRKDGSRFWATVQSTAYEYMGRRNTMTVIRDVSESVLHELALERTNRQLEEMQKQLRHSSRLAALGQMAAGVAHEINNPLQYILAGLEELGPALAGLPAEAKLAHADMCEGVERIRLMTRSLLPFASIDGAESEHVDLVEVVERACRVTARHTQPRARVELKLAPVPPIAAHRIRIGQLVTHLLTNAAQALLEGDPETNVITVTTSFTNGRVRLDVSDTGTGIPDSVRDRIFDPFFTTKPRDVGTGLGLPLCAEIVARSGGTIGFESKVGQGTRFVVTFEPARPRTPTAAPIVVARSPVRARVLVVDDEEPLLRTFGRFLKDCDVIPALGGARALELIDSGQVFDVIVCDLMMPDVDGMMVYAHALRTSPGLEQRIIFCTGGAFSDHVRTFLEGLSNVVLDKPVPSRLLCEAVGAAIGRPAPAALDPLPSA